MSASNKNARRFHGKVFLIAGGASGIGAAIAGRFEAEGGEAVIRADVTAPSDELQGQLHPSVRLDVTQKGSIDGVIDAVVRRYGRIDGLVNSAGIARVTPFLETSVDDFHRILGVNLRGAFLLGQAISRHMVERGEGVILNIGSVSGMIGNEGRSAYGASKAALVQLSKAMALELRSYGIRVNVLAPGPVTTPLAAVAHTGAASRIWIERVPLHRYGKPEEMAAAAAFLCSDDARSITGHVLVADGGFLSAGLQPTLGGNRPSM